MADQIKRVELTDDQRKLFARAIDRGHEVLAFDDNGRSKIVVRKASKRNKRIVFSGSLEDAALRDRK